MANVKSPEKYGISSRQVLKMVREMDAQVEDMHSIAIVCDEDVLFCKCKEPYTENNKQMLHSFAKSLNSIAVGIALEEGKLGFDDLVADHLREYLPESYDPRIEKLTVRDLLRMAASSCALSSYFRGVTSSWITHYFTFELPHEPGTTFQYDTGASYILSSLVTKTMGKTSFELMKERMFEPLGITDVAWLESPEGNTVGGWGIYLTTPDASKIAILLANGGRWKGRQLLPQAYLKEACSKQIDTPPNALTSYGYGYQFWIGMDNSFCVLGGFGNSAVINSEKCIGVVVTAGASGRLGDPNTIISTVANEELIVPSERGSMDEDPQALKELGDYLDSLKLGTVAGAGESCFEDEIFGKQLTFEENDRALNGLCIRRTAPDELGIEFDIAGKKTALKAGHGRWISCDAVFDDPIHHEHSCSYAFTSPRTLEIKQYLLNTSAFDLYVFGFKDGKVSGVISTSVKIGGTTPTQVRGLVCCQPV